MKRLIALLCVLAILLCAMLVVGCQDKDDETPGAGPTDGEDAGDETPGNEDAGNEDAGNGDSGNENPGDTPPVTPPPVSDGRNLQDSYVPDNFE